MIHNIDCKEGLRSLADNSVDSIVTDPPYELGFMGKKWDNTGIAYDAEMWGACLRVLKPGGYILAFSASRTYHRMTCAIEDAGFDIRDQIMWVYGSGFPKSTNVSRNIDRELGAERNKIKTPMGITGNKYAKGLGDSRPWMDKAAELGYHEHEDNNPVSEQAKQWNGWGTALKPAHEPICVARKPLSEKTVAANVLKHGTGAINIGGCRNGDRWPANLIHDGINEDWARYFYCAKASKKDRNDGLEGMPLKVAGALQGRNDGSLGSITYNQNNHPTVKPNELMRYLCRLVTPKGGLIVDPFAGSGSTGKAALQEGFQFLGFELEPEYSSLANSRLAVLGCSQS